MNGGQIAFLVVVVVLGLAGLLLAWPHIKRRQIRQRYEREWDFTGVSMVQAWAELYEAAETRGHGHWFKAIEGSPVRLTLVGGSKLVMEIASNRAEWPPEAGATVRLRVIVRVHNTSTREWCIDVVADANGEVPFGYDQDARYVHGTLCYASWMDAEKVARWAKKIHAQTRPRPY